MKTRRGHFCWCCGRARPNEKFSGRGHGRHLCRDCSKLPPEELAYRQVVRDIDRMVGWDGLVRRKQRKSLERFLSHPDERVRRYAQEVAANDAREREEYRQDRRAWEEAGDDLVWDSQRYNDAMNDDLPEVPRALVWDYPEAPKDLLWRLNRIAEFFPTRGRDRKTVRMLYEHRSALECAEEIRQLIEMYEEAYREREAGR
jgi:hypothetical protein